MFDKARAFLLSLTIITVLLFGAVGTTVAYADDPPPPTETPGPGIEPEGPPPGSTETPPPPAPTEPPAPLPPSGTGRGPRNVSPVLQRIPRNTSIAVVDGQGNLLPLAAQAAITALGSTDPIWCPEGQPPTPGENGCTPSFTSFTQLLTFLSGNATYTGPGIIYIQQGTYQGGESVIDFNDYDLSNISASALTLSGGWGDVGAITTFNRVSLIIGSSSNPWAGPVTLNNISITNPAQTGISINSQSDITLNKVSVTNSTNGAGAELTAGGSVTIADSAFTRNKTAGAIIRSVGGVAIENSDFSNPLNARRQIIGLDIITTGPDASVSLFQVLANNNRQAGATIDATGRVTIVESQFNGTKSVLNDEFFGYGLTVVSDDAIDLDGVQANDNFLWGASLTAAGDVTIANSTFNANTTESDDFIDDTGLLVVSGGSVSIFNSHADDNRLIGASIQAAGDVSISESTFSSNNGVLGQSTGNETFFGYGLQVVSTDGSITLSGVDASENTLFGAHLEAANGDVTVSNSSFSNNSSGNSSALVGRGLEIISGGDVFLDAVTLNNNQTFGANIESGGDIFLNGVTASGNGTNGVEVHTTNCGSLFLIGGTYTDNGQYGLSVLGTEIIQSVAPVFGGNGSGNIFEDPQGCAFAPPASPAPPVYQPNDPGAVVPDVPSNVLSNGNWNSVTASLNTFLAYHDIARRGLLIGPFTGKYGFVYLPSGMQVVLYAPNSSPELAMN